MWDSENIRTGVRSAWAGCLEVIFPRTCAGCGIHLSGHNTNYLCRHCGDSIDWICEPACTRCGAPFFGKMEESGICSVCRDAPPVFNQCKALFQYRGMGARLVHSLKYESGTWLLPQICQFIQERSKIMEFLHGATLVPIPLHWWKLHRRGYNQAEVIARAIQRCVSDTEIRDYLVRKRGTGSQTLLSRNDRMKNMKNAFSTKTTVRTDRRLILVDDVLTTGATLNAAASSLRRVGVKQISAFTLAHG